MWRPTLDQDGDEGAATLANLVRTHGPLPVTATAATGRDGGRHLLFAYAGADIRNSTNKLGPKLDVRGEGGYVVVAPSNHQSGRRYRWEQTDTIAPLPDWLRTLMLAPLPAPRPKITPAIVTATADTAYAALIRRASAYCAAAEGMGEGGRNDGVFRLAGSLAALVNEHGEALGEREILNLVRDFNQRCTPPLAEAELAKAVHSALHTGKPRDPKPPRHPLHRQIALRGREVSIHVA